MKEKIYKWSEIVGCILAVITVVTISFLAMFAIIETKLMATINIWLVLAVLVLVSLIYRRSPTHSNKVLTVLYWIDVAFLVVVTIATLIMYT